MANDHTKTPLSSKRRKDWNCPENTHHTLGNGLLLNEATTSTALAAAGAVAKPLHVFSTTITIRAPAITAASRRSQYSIFVPVC
mmetsp:Transcript_33973/g.66850  ORF Transcript_33973/g.66850 Transcript_33973/m.66850 type:complete len:84 (+) Transcript_33973:15-266(+)